MNAKKGLTEEELYALGSAFCARAEHCSSEVYARLMRGTDEEPLVARVMARLCEEKFIDDERYARAFIHDKLRFSRWGRLKIRQELWRKQIPESIYRPLLEEIDRRQYISILSSLLETKRKSVKGRDAYEVKMKLCRFAASRGFEPKYIYAALDLEGGEDADFDGENDF